MNKVEIAERLAARTGMNKGAAKDTVDGVFEVIGEALANGEEARILGFGAFGTRNRPLVPGATRGQARACGSRRRPFRGSSRAKGRNMPWAAARRRESVTPADRDGKRQR